MGVGSREGEIEDRTYTEDTLGRSGTCASQSSDPQVPALCNTSNHGSLQTVLVALANAR